MAQEGQVAAEMPKSEKPAWLMFGGLLLVLVWAYWNMFQEAYAAWQGGLYSHGYLIPFIAAVLFWLRRHPLVPVPMWQRWIGVGVMAGAILMRIYFCSFSVFDMWTFILAFVALILLVGGFSMLRWAGPIAILLIFMFPIPWQVERMLLDPLQNLATTVSVFCMQTMGFTAIQEGNTIHLANTQVGIAEQCSGLRMTTILLALSVALVLLNERSKLENAVILIMAIPIALTTNITRIVVTAMTKSFIPDNAAVDKFVHDAAGICMVPLALVLLIVLQVILSHLFIDDTGDEQTTMAMEAPGAVFWDDKHKIVD